MRPEKLKPLIWIGTSRRELIAMPETVQSEFGYALYVAQIGGTHRKSKPLKGFGGTRVMEIVSDHRGNSYRCILYRALFRAGSRIARFSEEIEERSRDTESRD
jgi:phage-related protein